MATTNSYITYVCEELAFLGDIKSKKMFGEYMVYLNDLPIITVCDNTCYVKKLDIISDLMKDAKTGYPYNGAKEHYILDLDNKTNLEAIIYKIASVTKKPKPKKKV